MDNAKFDNLVRFLGTRPSRRQVLKGLVGGGALAAVGMTGVIHEAAAQCLQDGEACEAGSECCSGNCDAVTGYCGTQDEECIADGGACVSGGDCCSGNCDATTGYCGTQDEECVADGGACVAGQDCCTGNCDATTGYCFTPSTGGTTTTTTLPASGSGPAQNADSTLLLPAVALGAAAVIGARRLRPSDQHDQTV